MNTPHNSRMAIVLALMLVLLVAVTINQFTQGGEEQQAAVLRAYAE